MKQSTITSENIYDFVVEFYINILKDPIVSPEFVRILGDDINNNLWKEHFETLTNFWETMILKKDTYEGVAFPAHATMTLHKATFEQWLVILDDTLNQCYESSCHEAFKHIGNIMVKNFMSRLNL